MTFLPLAERLRQAATTPEAQEGRRLRDAGISAAQDNAHPAWMRMMEECLRHCAQYLGEWTNDDVFAEFEQRAEIMRGLGETPPATHEPRAFGAVTVKLARQGLIEKTGEYRPSNRKTNHAQPIPVWRRAT